MQVEPHLNSDSGDNTSSCGRYANYLTKDNEYFFSHSRDNINLEEAISIIDDNSKGGIRKNEAKWYAPMYALSENECKFLVKKLFNKDVSNYEDLTNNEKNIYNKELINFARKCQDVMAKNFDREHLNIIDGSSLHYVGVIENKRKYRGTDIEVINGNKKQGEFKKGFHSHIHIIQSRKASNDKKSLISPLAKAKKNISKFGQMGFDRNRFFKDIETSFDELYNYKRPVEETLEYKKISKKNSLDNKVKPITERDHHLNQIIDDASIFGKAFEEAVRDTNKTKNNFFTQKQLKYWEKNITVKIYFKLLENDNKVKFKRENDKDLVYIDNNTGKEIYVSKTKNKWNSFGERKGGGVLKAIQSFENKNWKNSVFTLKELSDYRQQEKFIKRKRFEFRKKRNNIRSMRLKIENVSKKPMGFLTKKLSDNFKNISQNQVSILFEQVQFRNIEGKKYTSLGMKNISGGYTVFNGEKSRTVGNKDLIFINNKYSKDLIIFKKIKDYIDYINENNGLIPRKNIVILQDNDYINNLKNIVESNKIDEIHLYSNDKYLQSRISAIKDSNFIISDKKSRKI